jgi:hypothetical protein
MFSGPPKPACLDPQKFRSRTPNWLRNVKNQKKIGKKFHGKFSEFFWKTWLAEICKADPRVTSNNNLYTNWYLKYQLVFEIPIAFLSASI